MKDRIRLTDAEKLKKQSKEEYESYITEKKENKNDHYVFMNSGML